MLSISRRKLMGLSLGAAAGVSLPALARSALTPEQLESELLDIMASESDNDELFDFVGARAILDSDLKRYQRFPGDWSWWTLDGVDKPNPEWAPNAFGVDTKHLAPFELPAGHVFSLSGADLDWLARKNDFSLFNSEPRVLFGLRGASLASGDDETEFADELRVTITPPDHRTFRCLMGVWDRDTNKICAFTASTVPEVSYMWGFVLQERKTNMLPTGLYAYDVGTHGLSGKQKLWQRGAFLLRGARFEDESGPSKPVLVIRSFGDLSYDPRDKHDAWNISLAHDNIHSSIFAQNWGDGFIARGAQQFSSAGCQVVKGAYAFQPGVRAFSRSPSGPWSAFRRAAGLTQEAYAGVDGAESSSAQDGRRFQYMLFSSIEAAFAAQANRAVTDNDDVHKSIAKDYAPLRFGSSGERARALQQKLSAALPAQYRPTSIDGRLGAISIDSLLAYQQLILGIVETPVYTQALLNE